MYNASVQERISHGLRERWLPLLVFSCGAAVSLAVWGLLVGDRREQLSESSREVASETRDAIQRWYETQLAALQLQARRWSRGGEPDRDEWRAEAELLRSSSGGVAALAWVAIEAGGVRILDAVPGPFALDALERRDRAADRAEALGPVRDASGAASYLLVLPERAAPRRATALVAQVRIADGLTPLLRARARGYALSVRWAGEEVFARGEPSRDRRQDWWRTAETVPLPLGSAWELVLRPTSELAAARLTPLPHYLLGAGLLTSLLLAVLLQQLRVTSRQARFLAVTNRALEERGNALRELNRELESRVAERTADLRAAVDELEAFNYSVSHDLRSPLGAILNFSAILEEDYAGKPLDDGAITWLARIRSSANRASALLEDLLRLSRAGRVALQREEVDMAALAREAFAQVRAAQDDPEVELVVEKLPNVEGDRSLLGDVFANLLNNAFKYSRGRDERRVVVRGREEGEEAIFEVADNGSGFEMRFAEKLFGLFERLHPDEEVEGTGVGLAMVARIVTRHGGRVWARGAPDEGACFTFALPRRREPVP